MRRPFMIPKSSARRLDGRVPARVCEPKMSETNVIEYCYDVYRAAPAAKKTVVVG